MPLDHDPLIPDIVAAAMRLTPAVRAARDEAEQMRQTPPQLAAEITRAGIYQMYLPRSMGGPETAPLTAFRVVEELSKADGSVGWCAMIATAPPWAPCSSAIRSPGLATTGLDLLRIRRRVCDGRGVLALYGPGDETVEASAG